MELLIVATVGCGGRDPNLPATYPVQGIVTYQGQPVQNGSVVFRPEGSGNSARGVTDAQGEFTLSTYEKADGAVSGKHKVTVEVMQGRGSAAPRRVLLEASPIPVKYADRETSPLEVVVKEGHNHPKLTLQN